MKDFSEWTDLTSSDFSDGSVSTEEAARFGENLDSFLSALDFPESEVEDSCIEPESTTWNAVDSAVEWFYKNGENDFFELNLPVDRIRSLVNQFRNRKPLMPK